MLGISNVLTAMDGALKGGASAGQSVISTMKTTYPSHPGPGNLTDATTVNKVDDISKEPLTTLSSLPEIGCETEESKIR